MSSTLEKCRRQYQQYQDKIRKNFRIRRLVNQPDRKRVADRIQKGLPPITENKSYLWVVALFPDDAHAMALSDADVKRAIKRAKANNEDWRDPEEIPLELTW